MSIAKLNELARYELYRHLTHSSLPTLDIPMNGVDFNTLEIRITTSTGKVSGPHIFDIRGPFTIGNIPLTDWLIGWVMDNFALTVPSHHKSSDLISRVFRVGALLHLLCSTDASTEQAITLINGTFCNNAYEQHNLGVHLQDLVYCFLKQTLETVLDDMRSKDFVVQSYQESRMSFAATALLHQELKHFRQCLEDGILSRTDLLPGRFKQLLISDLSSMEVVLDSRLQVTCAQFPHWRAVIYRLANDLSRTAETIQLSLILTQVKYFDTQTGSPSQEEQPYTPWGNGQGCLLPVPSTNMALVAGLSNDIDEGTDQRFDHVSDLGLNATRVETSVLITSSLFPGLRHHIRYANHQEM